MFNFISDLDRLGNYFRLDLRLPSDKDTNQLIIRFISSAIGKI